MASITAGNTGAEAAAASGGITLGAPASPVTDDIWIACIHSSDQVAHTLTDWTQIVQGNGSGTTSRLSVWYFRYAGSTPNLIVGHTAGATIIGGIKAYVGCKKTGSPVNVAGTITAGPTDASIEHAAITPTKPNCALLVINGAADDNNRTALGGDYAVVFEDTAGGTQNCYQDASGTPDGSLSLFHDLSVPASDTGIITVTQAASDPWASVLIALEPEQAAVNAAAGAYALTGSAGTVVAGRAVDAAAGAYALTGSDATLPVARMLDAALGAYGLTGAAGTLLRDALLDAGLGSYLLTGADAALQHGFVLDVAAGLYVLAEVDATLLAERLLGADLGTYNLTGAAGTLLADRFLVALADAYTLAGVDASLLVGRGVFAEAGAYLLTGADAAVLASRLLAGDAGAYGLTGADAGALAERLLAASTGAYVLVGANATLVVVGAGGPTEYFRAWRTSSWRRSATTA
jgi:hypothetical protein